MPERTIALAMRRCYSTKPIEEIELELDQKGPEYWKYLLTRALQDKSLDVIEHFCLSFLVEGLEDGRAFQLLRDYPFLKLLKLGEGAWLVSMNARTLVEMWRDGAHGDFVQAVVAELGSKGVCRVFNAVAFGGLNAG